MLDNPVFSMPQHAISEYVKFLRPDRLPQAKRNKFEELFSEFAREPHPDFIWVHEQLNARGVSSDRPYSMRRFSGGRELPRGRYYAVCEDHAGHSGQTLAMEILAYSDRSKGQIIELFDLNDPNIGTIRDRLDRALAEEAREVNWNALLVKSAPLVTEGEQAFEQLIVPYEVAPFSRKRVFDLRRRETLAWLLRALNEDFPNTVFTKYEQAQGKTLPSPLSAVSPREPDGAEARRRLIAGGKFGPGLKSIGEELRGLIDLLPYLLDNRLGGTPITELIGACAIEQNCDSLIYPSVRTDSGILYEGVALKSAWGWNIVDLENAPPSRIQAFISCCINPSEYAQGVQGSFVFTPAPGESTSTTDPHQIGGWTAHGFSQTTMESALRDLWVLQISKLPGGDYEFTEPMIVTRTPRRGRDHTVMPRKPWPYSSFGHILLGLGTGEILMQSRIENGSDRAKTVGELLTQFASNPIWGNPLPTAYQNSWYLLQRTKQGGFQVLCPLCRATSKIDAAALTGEGVTLAACPHCGFAAEPRSQKMLGQ